MKNIVAVNASPRIGWNTSTLITEAAEGAKAAGAAVQIFNLSRLDKYSGCMSCFACKRKPNEGTCVYKDGLAPVLQAIRESDGLILGSPNYLGDVTAMFRALYERLIFQSLTYQKAPHRYEIKKIPVLFIMTSNTPKEFYMPVGYSHTIKAYQKALEDAVGNTKVMIAGNTLQVKDYSLYNWTMFSPEAKQKAHDTEFPKEKEKAFSLGEEMVRSGW